TTRFRSGLYAYWRTTVSRSAESTRWGVVAVGVMRYSDGISAASGFQLKYNAPSAPQKAPSGDVPIHFGSRMMCSTVSADCCAYNSWKPRKATESNSLYMGW